MWEKVLQSTASDLVSTFTRRNQLNQLFACSAHPPWVLKDAVQESDNSKHAGSQVQYKRLFLTASQSQTVARQLDPGSGKQQHGGGALLSSRPLAMFPLGLHFHDSASPSGSRRSRSVQNSQQTRA